MSETHRWVGTDEAGLDREADAGVTLDGDRSNEASPDARWSGVWNRRKMPRQAGTRVSACMGACVP